VITVPAAQVTSCAFGGTGLNTLFITTSRLGLDDPERGVGALFAINVPFTGVPIGPFGG